MFHTRLQFSLFLYLFLILSFGSYKSFAGADPDELTLEQEQALQVDREEVIKYEKESVQNISLITNICISFPEAIAYKEHFACKADAEKNRITRRNWSFTKLLLE